MYLNVKYKFPEKTSLLSFLFIFIFSSEFYGYELKTRYVTIAYSNEYDLRRFNKDIYLGSLSYLLRNRKSVTAGDDAKNRLDVIVEKVESILEMHLRVVSPMVPG